MDLKWINLILKISSENILTLLSSLLKALIKSINDNLNEHIPKYAKQINLKLINIIKKNNTNKDINWNKLIKTLIMFINTEIEIFDCDSCCESLIWINLLLDSNYNNVNLKIFVIN